LIPSACGLSLARPYLGLAQLGARSFSSLLQGQRRRYGRHLQPESCSRDSDIVLRGWVLNIDALILCVLGGTAARVVFARPQ
jgi:hypothetical protein